jgi:hypothetical protein
MARSKKAMLGKRTPPSKAEIQEALQIIALGSRRGAQGGSVLSFLKGIPGRVKDAVLGGPRLDFPPPVRRFLGEHGNNVITSLVVSRAPIQSFIHKALETLTQGRWQDARKKKYDEFFHLSMVAEFQDSKGSQRRCVLEKNEVIHVGSSFKSEKDAQFLPVDLKGKTITINELLNSARKAMGDQDFFIYDAFGGRNCQNFIVGLLRGSGLLTPAAEAWILQPIETVLAELPGYTRHVAKALTDVAATANVVLHGRGARPAARRRRAK